MKNTIIILSVLAVLLICIAGVRLAQAPFAAPRAATPAPAAVVEPASSAPAEPAPGQNFVNAMTTKGGSDAPPGLEGAIGAGRPTYDVDINDASGGQDGNKQGLDDAKDKIGKLPLGGKP